jgi:hypothetical protein
LYVTGLFTKISLKEKWVPAACVASALFTLLLNNWCIRAFRFDFGFMNILVNAVSTVVFLMAIRRRGA